mmetsp:Transcript_20684/g.33417  ORF Transcript_20684/g.33417 Transcript_20684/m.33417 type:complete len:260 (+) Transcript_20684:89-868(+)
MGNSVECQRCCSEEKKNEVDMSMPSYPAHASYVLQHDDKVTHKTDAHGNVSTTPRFDDTAKIEDMRPFGGLENRGPLESPNADDQERHSPRGANSPRAPNSGGRSPHGDRPPNSGRTAAEWANDQEQFSHLPPLPAGWIRVKSRSTGAIYYCCSETGETTFVEPTANQAVTKSSDLPSGWVEMVSRSTGRTYYWNSTLQKSQFEKPTMVDTQPSPQPGNDNEGLPPDWTSMISRSTGRTYYFNSKLQKSQYDRPTTSEG